MTALLPKLFPLLNVIEVSTASVPKQIFVVKPTIWLFSELLKTLPSILSQALDPRSQALDPR